MFNPFTLSSKVPTSLFIALQTGDHPAVLSADQTVSGCVPAGLRLPRVALGPGRPGAAGRLAAEADRRPAPLPPLPEPYLFGRPAALRLRLAMPPAAELAGRLCRRWPPGDVLSVLESLPPGRRQACRQPLLDQLTAELRRRTRER